MGQRKKITFFYGWLIVIAAFWIQSVAWGTAITFGIFFKPLLAEFGWTRAMASGAFSVNTVLRGLLGIVVGGLNNKLGPRILVTACGIFLGLGYLLMSQVSAIWQLYLFFGVMVSIGMSASFIPAATTLAAWFVKKRGIATAIFVAGGSFGCMIMAPLSNLFISNYGWRSSYIILGSMAMVLIILAAQFLKRDPRELGQLPYGAKQVKKENFNREAEGLSLHEATSTKYFWIFCLIIFCGYFSHFIVLVHLVPHAIDIGIPASNAANLLAITTGTAIVGRVMIGAAADRIGNRQVFLICFVLLLFAFAWLIVAREFWMLCVFAFIFGLTGSVCVVLSSPMVAELFGLVSHSAILGAVMLISTIAGAAGPLFAGYIFDRNGCYQATFIICIGIYLIGALSTFLLQGAEKEGLAHA